jgi:bacterioferritin-associated ferredoxin
MIVCHCHRINDRTIRAAISAGAHCEEAVAKICGAGSCCGGCVPVITDLIAEERGRPRRLPLISSAA